MRISIIVLFIGIVFSPILSQNDLFRSVLEEYFEEDGTGVTAIISKGGKIVYRDAIGKAHLELDVDMQPEYILRLGSITKQFTAVAILQLVESGKINLDANMSQYLPEYPLGDREVSVRQLLNHTSGIMSYTNIPGWMAAETRKRYMLDSLIAEFKDLPFEFEPGAAWNYNNSGYILLGAIIEAVSGDSYEAYLQKNIFDKIGMENSYYDDHRKIIPNRVPGYMPGPTGPLNMEFLDMTIPYAAGSLVSNVDDLAKWNEAVFNYELVGKEILMQAFEPAKLNDGSTYDYGFGWGIGKIRGSQVYQHGGGIYGFLTMGIYAPEEDIYIAVLSNCNCIPPSDAANKLMAAALGDPVPISGYKAEKEDFASYVGSYATGESDEMRFIRMEEESLTSQRGKGRKFNLTPVAKDEFLIEGTLSVLKFKRENDKITGHNLIQISGESNWAEKASNEILAKDIIVPQEILDTYAGKYKLSNGLILNIKSEEGKLLGAPEGQGEVELVANSMIEFLVPEFNVKITFLKDEEGMVNGMDFIQGDMTAKGEKLE